MSGILANSVSVTMSSAIPNGVMPGFSVGELVTLTTTPIGTEYYWYVEGPDKSIVALDSVRGSTSHFIPDKIGTYQIGVKVGTTYYSLQITAQISNLIVTTPIRLDARTYGVSAAATASVNSGALNAAFAAAIAAGPSILELPPGTINFDSQIRLDRPRGLTVIGAGKNATILNWVGASPGTETAILLYNARECEFEGITLRGTVNPPTNGWEVRGDNNDPLIAGLPAGGCVWRRCDTYIASDFGVHYTIAAGAPQANNDQGRFEHCAIEGQVISNVEIGTANGDANPNAKQFLFLHCTMAESQYGIRVWEGSFTCVEGFQALHTVADFAFQKWCQDGPAIYRVRSESSARYIVTVNDTATYPIGAGIAGNLSVWGGSFGTDQLHADGAVIVLRHPGPFLIEGFQFGDLEQDIPHIQCDAANFTNAGAPIDPASVTVRDCLFAAASTGNSPADFEPVEFNGTNRIYHATGNLFARKTGTLYSFEQREESHGQPEKAATLAALRALAVNLRYSGDTIILGTARRYAYSPTAGADTIDDSLTSVKPDALVSTDPGIWSLVTDGHITVENLLDLRRMDPTRFASATALCDLVLGDAGGGNFVYVYGSAAADDNATIITPSRYASFIAADENDLTSDGWILGDATATIDTVTDTTTNQNHYIVHALYATIAVAVTLQYDVRAVPGSSQDRLDLVANAGASTLLVDCTLGTIVSQAGVSGASVTATHDGWFRVEVTLTLASDPAVYFVIKQFGAYIGDGNGSVRLRRVVARQNASGNGRWLKV